jgi:glycosyltransferase involved in cell wall biosynthesis
MKEQKEIMLKQKVAFFKSGGFSHTNDSILKQLIINFPEYDFEVIDIHKDLMKQKVLFSIIHCFLEYGRDILLNRKGIIETFERTSYFFNTVKREIKKRMSSKDYAFTFQTQSSFDASISGIPHFIYTDHTHKTNLNYPGYQQKKYLGDKWIDLEKKIYHNATLNLTWSTNIAKSIVEDYFCNIEKVICVYCGANADIAKDQIFDDNRFSYKNILFVGIDWQRKGGPVLAEAFKTVLKTYPDSTLTIVGCSPNLDIQNCNVIGRVPIEEVEKYYKQASVFCLPTTLEPFGIVFLEAMSNKLPIISTNIGAIPDFIHDGQNGYLVEPNNPQQISESIIRLLGSTVKCKAFGELGYEIYKGTYTWEKTGIRIRDSIKKYLN